MNRASAAGTATNVLHGESPGTVVIDWPLAAIDLRDLRVIELDQATRETAYRVLLRNLQLRAHSEADACRTIEVTSSLGAQSTLEGAPLLILFAAGIVLGGDKTCLTIVKPSAEKPLTILCADDHTLVGDALTKVFATAGYIVDRASDGVEAWTKLSADLRRFDVLITDDQMPRLGGLQLVGRLHDAGYPGRIIVYSAALTEEDESLYRGMGVDAIVVKSPDAAKLLAIVKAFHRQE
jgi:CheY-like chemotaxis protein